MELFSRSGKTCCLFIKLVSIYLFKSVSDSCRFIFNQREAAAQLYQLQFLLINNTLGPAVTRLGQTGSSTAKKCLNITLTHLSSSQSTLIDINGIKLENIVSTRVSPSQLLDDIGLCLVFTQTKRMQFRASQHQMSATYYDDIPGVPIKMWQQPPGTVVLLPHFFWDTQYMLFLLLYV